MRRPLRLVQNVWQTLHAEIPCRKSQRAELVLQFRPRLQHGVLLILDLRVVADATKMDHAKQTAILEANSLPIRRVYPVELEFAGEPIPPHTAKRTALGRRHHNGAAGQRRQACRYDFDPPQWISVDL